MPVDLDERAFAERLGSFDSVPVLIADVTKLNLDHRIAFVLRLMDGRSSVDDILDMSGLPRLDVLRVVDLLVANNVIALR